MSKLNRRAISLLACFFVTVFSVTLTRAQRGEPTTESEPAPTPGIDWATIQMPRHDLPDTEAREFGEQIENLPVPEPSTVIGTDNTTYTVQLGDKLAVLASHFGVTVTALATYNDIANPNLIFPGQVLRIPSADTPPPPQPDSNLPSVLENGYTVQAGDTLHQIALHFGVTVQALVTANGITNPQRIYPGQVLQLSASADTSPTATPVPPLSAEPTPILVTDGQITYTVQVGDSLNKIAKRFGVTVEAVGITNQLNNWWLIYPGQVLVIPAADAPLPTPSPIPEGLLFIWPVDSRSIAQGYRWGHRAIDIVVPVETPILSIADGTVEFSGWNGYGYGYLVVVDHGNGTRSLYAHNDSLVVTTEQIVAQGETLSLSGSSGYSTIPHVHLEMWVDHAVVNPCNHLPGGC